MIITLFSLLMVTRYALCDCHGTSAFAVPVTDVVLSNSEVFRGVPISLGTPPQNISLLPNAWYNDTWIYNDTATFCSGNTLAACTTIRGGLYDTNSSTYRAAANVEGAGGDASDTTEGSTMHGIWINAWATDIMTVGNASLPDYPIGMPGFDIFTPYVTQAELGLGHNSTILNTLMSASRITSRSFSYWFGWNGAAASHNMDGAVVFGGYDAAKTSGSNNTYSLSPRTVACSTGMLVNVRDVVLNFPNGSDVSIFGGSQSISTCVVPDYPLLFTFPWQPIYSNFEAYTQTSNIGRSFGMAFYGMLYSADSVYGGGLTIQLDNNLNIEIPNELLVTSEPNVAPDGSIQYNRSASEVMLNPTLEYNQYDTAKLGRHFFQAAYLSVDYDQNSFWIWQANKTAESHIIPLGETCRPVQSNSTATSISTSTPSPVVTPARRVSRPGASTGVIAGITAGCIIAACSLGALTAVLILRFRRRQRSLAAGDSVISLAPRNSDQVIELDSAGRAVPPQEMAATMDPRELAGDMRDPGIASWKGGHDGDQLVELGT